MPVRPAPRAAAPIEEEETGEADAAAQPAAKAKVRLKKRDRADARQLAANMKCAKAETRRVARAAARACARPAAPPPATADMTRKDAAKWRRAFLAALIAPGAEACGLTAMANAAQQAPPTRKRAAWSALATLWHAHGFGPGLRATSQLDTPLPSMPCRAVSERAMVAECGGRLDFRAALRDGEVELVAGSAVGALRYRWSRAAEAGGA